MQDFNSAVLARLPAPFPLITEEKDGAGVVTAGLQPLCVNDSKEIRSSAWKKK